MVRLILRCAAATALSFAHLFASSRELPRREHAVVYNFTTAIAAHLSQTGTMPRNLEEIKEYTDLRFDLNAPDIEAFPERYALVDPPAELPNRGKIVLISIETLISPRVKVAGQPGRLIGFVKKDGTPESMFIDEATAVTLVSNLAELEPIRGTIPAPSWAKPPSTEPVMSETMKRAIEMKERGELPPPPRRDQKHWRDQKQQAAPTAPITSPGPPAPPPAPLRWIIGAIAALTVVVLIVRCKKPQA